MYQFKYVIGSLLIAIFFSNVYCFSSTTITSLNALTINGDKRFYMNIGETISKSSIGILNLTIPSNEMNRRRFIQFSSSFNLANINVTQFFNLTYGSTLIKYTDNLPETIIFDSNNLTVNISFDFSKIFMLNNALNPFYITIGTELCSGNFSLPKTSDSYIIKGYQGILQQFNLILPVGITKALFKMTLEDISTSSSVDCFWMDFFGENRHILPYKYYYFNQKTALSYQVEDTTGKRLFSFNYTVESINDNVVELSQPTYELQTPGNYLFLIKPNTFSNINGVMFKKSQEIFTNNQTYRLFKLEVNSMLTNGNCLGFPYDRFSPDPTIFCKGYSYYGHIRIQVLTTPVIFDSLTTCQINSGRKTYCVQIGSTGNYIVSSWNLGALAEQYDVSSSGVYTSLDVGIGVINYAVGNTYLYRSYFKHSTAGVLNVEHLRNNEKSYIVAANGYFRLVPPNTPSTILGFYYASSSHSNQAVYVYRQPQSSMTLYAALSTTSMYDNDTLMVSAYPKTCPEEVSADGFYSLPTAINTYSFKVKSIKHYGLISWKSEYSVCMKICLRNGCYKRCSSTVISSVMADSFIIPPFENAQITLSASYSIKFIYQIINTLLIENCDVGYGYRTITGCESILCRYDTYPTASCAKTLTSSDDELDSSTWFLVLGIIGFYGGIPLLVLICNFEWSEVEFEMERIKKRRQK
eukprot:TRINITY_DN14246_c0_g1_i1.p1 TRINITY_DN14246_c0_g1~~TRINITY_DN14246_c0_g1_i1.p1  ORF type:complete len:705 (+),score=89.59 TRINITY_DN14246_c0_g1_i1:34-2115(+)